MNDMWQVKYGINEDGFLYNIKFSNERRDQITLPFHKEGKYIGPKLSYKKDGINKEIMFTKEACFDEEKILVSEIDGILYSMKYTIEDGMGVICINAKNQSDTEYLYEKLSLCLGVDTYMDSYPDWNDKFFPTMLRCEKTHFWGYFMSPIGKIVAIASKDKIASWDMIYNEVNNYGGHRIHTVSLDLLSSMKLPSRHPEDIKGIKPNETKSWKLYLMPVDSINDIKSTLNEMCDIPMLEAKRYTIFENENLELDLITNEQVKLYIASENDSDFKFVGNYDGDNKHTTYKELKEPGVYILKAITESGYISECRIYVRKQWSWYLKAARKEAVVKAQKPSTHLESWYGCFSAFLAAKHFKEDVIDTKMLEHFNKILSLMYDIDKSEPVIIPKRICNTASMISLLVDVYEAHKDIKYLKIASGLADWLIKKQGKDGAYRTETGWSSGREDELGEHYTSVIYMAKSMLELVLVEQEIMGEDEYWKAQYNKHYLSVKRAIDDLERRKDDIGTEGEHTFEDGMISCSALQLGMFALIQNSNEEKDKYASVAKYMIKKHRCLEQMLVPDCRMRGGTIRFWEAQYDVMLDKNMINSPHGWTSWKTYATWYLYLLTGQIEYLEQTMDTLGACMQMIDLENENLRWAFIVDPSLEVNIWKDNLESDKKGIRQKSVIGENYVEMISGWYKTPDGKVAMHGGKNVAKDYSNPHLPDDGWCCDNDVHEHFKCLEEVALTSLYVYEKDDGELEAWNAKVIKEDNMLIITPNEEIVKSIHLNLKGVYDIVVNDEIIYSMDEKDEKMFWLHMS